MAKIYAIFMVLICLFSSLLVYPKKTSYSHKSYTPKSIYSGYGKVSKSTGKIKTKSTRGYYKKSNGYKYVNSYSRS